MVFMSTRKSRPNIAGPMSLPSSVYKKFFSDMNEIRHECRGHDGMPYDPIQGQGQGQGHGGPKVAKMADFKVYLLRQ